MDRRWIAALALVVLTPVNLFFFLNARRAEGAGPAEGTGFIRVHVIDESTRKPIEGAVVVVAETEQRLRTDVQGWTPRVEAPVLRARRFRPIVAQLHGQLSLVVYKNGYRDALYFGVRMRPQSTQYPEVWMAKVTRQDRRLEPTYYHTPFHHLWLVRMADAFRKPDQLGLGPERPQLSLPQTWGPELLGDAAGRRR